MRTLGKMLLIGGLLVAAYALLGYDTTVAGHDGQRIHNIGLLQDRQNLLIASCVAAIIGALLVATNKGEGRTNRASTPNSSSEPPTWSPTAERFHTALTQADIATVESMLSSKEVWPDGELATGRGYLQYAVLAKNKPLIELLIKRGALPSQKDRLGQSASELAEKGTDDDVVRLVGKPATPASPTEERPGPLLIADEIIKLAELLDRGLLTREEFAAQKTALLAARKPTTG
jgi:hypothetical protein